MSTADQKQHLSALINHIFFHFSKRISSIYLETRFITFLFRWTETKYSQEHFIYLVHLGNDNVKMFISDKSQRKYIFFYSFIKFSSVKKITNKKGCH